MARSATPAVSGVLSTGAISTVNNTGTVNLGTGTAISVGGGSTVNNAANPGALPTVALTAAAADTNTLNINGSRNISVLVTNLMC